MQYQTRQAKRRKQAAERELEDLKFEKENLEILRNCRTIWDAVVLYLEKVELNAQDRAELHEALRVLCRGRTKP